MRIADEILSEDRSEEEVLQLYGMDEGTGLALPLVGEVLGKLAPAWDDEIDWTYGKQLKHELLTAKDEISLISLAQHGGVRGIEARDRLVACNQRLVLHEARKSRGGPRQDLSLMDLVQEGNFGLFKAIEKFDLRKGYRFSTYATWWIRQAIHRGIDDYGRGIRLPVWFAEELRRLRRVMATLQQEHHDDLTPEVLAERMECSVEHLVDLLIGQEELLSLDIKTDEDEDRSEFGSMIADTSPQPDEEAIDNVIADEIQHLLESILKPRELKVITWRYGFDGRTPLSLEQVGKRLKITRERARQIQVAAQKKLKADPDFQRLVG